MSEVDIKGTLQAWRVAADLIQTWEPLIEQERVRESTGRGPSLRQLFQMLDKMRSQRMSPAVITNLMNWSTSRYHALCGLDRLLPIVWDFLDAHPSVSITKAADLSRLPRPQQEIKLREMIAAFNAPKQRLWNGRRA